MNNKAILLRSVSTLATAAASTALGVQGAQAQVVPAGTDGYYYSVTGGFALSKSEQFLTGLNDKLGAPTHDVSGSSFTNDGSGNYNSSWSSSYASSNNSGLDDFKGLFASVSFGKQMGEFDVRGTVSMTGGRSEGYAYGYSGASSFSFFGVSGNSVSYSGHTSGSSYSEYEAEGKYTSSLLAADFEVGYTPTLSNNFNVRLFAGVRALHFSEKFEGTVSGSSNYYSAYSSVSTEPSGNFLDTRSGGRGNDFYEGVFNATFTGIGPRIGVQGSTRFEGSNFGLSGSLATSVIFGKQTVSFSGYHSWFGSSFSGFDTSGNGSSNSTHYSGSSSTSGYTRSGNKTVLDIQASAGVDYYLNDKTVLTVGYQAEKLLEVAGDDLGAGTNIDSLTHGAFIKLSGSF